MSEIRVSRQAEADLIEIWLAVAETSVPAADRMITRIVNKYPTLVRFPEMATRCDELAPGVRALPVGSYVIFYRPFPQGIEVLRVLHGARDIRRLFER